jgi:hypothetical protein
MADIAALTSDLKSAYDALKAKADTAIGNLNNYAQWNDAGVGYIAGASGTPPSNALLYADTGRLPIETIKSADNMIAEVNRLIDGIAQVHYVPIVAIPSFAMQDHKIWDDPFATKLEQAMSDYLDTMGIPDASFQNAIFNESIQRNQQTLNDLLELADAKVGARGFTNPNSMVTALRLDAQQKYQFDRNQINRDVTKLVTEWARQNYHMAIEKGITFEQFQADFTYKYCTAFVDIYKNMVLASVEQFKAELSQYIEPIRAYTEAAKLPVEVGKINADIGKANAELDIQQTKVQIEEATQTFQTRTQASIATFQTQVNALGAVARETAAFIQSASRSVIGIQK